MVEGGAYLGQLGEHIFPQLSALTQKMCNGPISDLWYSTARNDCRASQLNPLPLPSLKTYIGLHLSCGSRDLHGLCLQLLPHLSKLVLLLLILSIQSLTHLIKCLLHLPTDLHGEWDEEGGGQSRNVKGHMTPNEIGEI